MKRSVIIAMQTDGAICLSECDRIQVSPVLTKFDPKNTAASKWFRTLWRTVGQQTITIANGLEKRVSCLLIRSVRIAFAALIAFNFCVGVPALASEHKDVLNRGVVAIANKNFALAIEIYSRMLDQTLPIEQRRELLRFRSTAFDLAKQIERAEADLTAAVNLGEPDPRALEDRGFFYLKYDQIDPALADFEAGAQLEPNNALFAYGKGRVFSAKRQYAAAVEQYSRAIALDSSGVRYWLWRGEAFALSGNYPRAIGDYDRALTLGTLNRRELGQLRVGRGDANMQMNEFRAAVADLDAALALNPENALALRMRGMAYERLGDVSRARGDYQNALKLRPNDTWLKDRMQRLR